MSSFPNLSMMLSFLYPCFLVFGMTVATCSHNTHMQRQAGEVEFGYGLQDGPDVWHILSENNTLCKEGKNQSPIDLNVDMQPIDKEISINYGWRTTGRFENLGTTLEVTPSKGGNQSHSITLDNVRYNLQQFHLHTPSEHHIDGEYFPLEMHLVHESQDERLLVLALLFNVGISRGSNPLLRFLSSFVPVIRKKDTYVNLMELEMASLVDSLEPTSIATYSGSLTTPPCSEGVTWLVYLNPLKIDAWTLQSFKRILKFNSRHIQRTPSHSNEAECRGNEGEGPQVED